VDQRKGAHDWAICAVPTADGETASGARLVGRDLMAVGSLDREFVCHVM
jgi:hypothetical protein